MQISLQLEGLSKDFIEVRKKTMELFSPLSIEDAVIQSSDFGSPPNWHLAHVTWFFQKVLEKYSTIHTLLKDDIDLAYLNSYYQKYGSILKKSERGKYPRPTVLQTIKYRKEIEKLFLDFLRFDDIHSIESPSELIRDIQTAINHERQHQELMVYDFQHYYSRFIHEHDNYIPKFNSSVTVSEKVQKEMIGIPGGIFVMGYKGSEFCYDNELPEHRVYINDYKIDNSLVTNKEFIEFIEAGGYHNYRYWLADGWDLVTTEDWNSPLYWSFDKDRNKWTKKDFRGVHGIRENEPVTNVSYYEADAFCKWAKKRLPTEAEWEKAASWDDSTESKTLYPWGNNEVTSEHANLLDMPICQYTLQT